MPTYEYKCSACKHGFEIFQSIKDAAKRKCPECGKNTLERVIGPGAALIFKGSGFYQTDYRSESYKKAAEADKPKAESSSSDSKPAETKAEKKTESKSSESKSSGGKSKAKKPAGSGA
jgi:putative FmdB family regulatory protein